MQREAISTPNVRIELEYPILSPFQIATLWRKYPQNATYCGLNDNEFRIKQEMYVCCSAAHFSRFEFFAKSEKNQPIFREKVPTLISNT